MTDNSLNISIPLRFEIRSPPRGMTDYDPKALSAEEQNELNIFKSNLKRENHIFLAEHPEIRAIAAMIVRMTIVHQPRNIIDFIAKIFSRPEQQIRKDVQNILNELDIEYEVVPFMEFFDWDY